VRSAEIAAQTNALALNATIQATRAASGTGNFAGVVGDIKTLAERIGNAECRHHAPPHHDPRRDQRHRSARCARSCRSSTSCCSRPAPSRSRWNGRTLVSREIADSMTAAANGSINVSSSVGRLKATIEDARGASMKVVTKATDMADEAHRLDSTVKSFLREVTA
jgi:hypothetical protein